MELKFVGGNERFDCRMVKKANGPVFAELTRYVE